MSTGLMTAADLEQVSGKKRYSAQAAWFKAQFGVDVPRRHDGSIALTWETFHVLTEAKLGLRAAEARVEVSMERPPIYAVGKA
ncbi:MULTISPECIES: DUF4224 domain-containing protein [Burkholderia cepacia complex]|uniref:DUF4224 domain-containing protein n=1 Tax=Burkholderia cepacia complex TaxID=87882 RepID=UPI0007C770A9|nr:MULTISPECIES: DUF4224 domain-containing protein [Burkholderia cepacia complex]RQS84386.1 DUF4224 domain-containing protein [Burkholderia seminalis]